MSMNNSLNIRSIAILGCGWLGLALGKSLAQKGWEVNGSTTRKEKFSELSLAGIQPFQIRVSNQGIVGDNLKDFFDVQTLFLNIPPGRRRTDVDVLYPQEIKHVVETAYSLGVRQIVFASSTGVYPNSAKEVDEDTKVAPVTQSGKGLVLAEEIVKTKKELNSLVLRFAGLVGGERKAGRWFAGKKNVKGGKAKVNMVHQTDCIGAIETLLNKEIWNEVFNVVADEHPTRAEFYKAQCEKEGFEVPTFLDEDSTNYKIVLNKKLKDRTGYEFKLPNPIHF